MKTMLLNRLRTATAIAAFGALSAHAVGCTNDDVGSQVDDITELKQTAVKKQSIGNCWIYASVGWMESLVLTESGTELNLSESYITYWHWFEQLNDGATGRTALAWMREDDELSTGGWWHVASDISLRYGLLEEGAFISEEAEDIRSARQKSALNKINEELKEGGRLATRTQRADAQNVMNVLNEAWELDAAVVANLQAVFGDAAERTVAEGTIPEGFPLQRANEIQVGQDCTTGETISLADAMGTSSGSGWWNAGSRLGRHAWQAKSYPSSASSRRSMQIEMQRALHNRLPVIISWFVDFNALENDNTFRAVPEEPGRQGGHMTVMHDYQAADVPGFGTLEAGTLVTDQAALDAALSPDARIEFLRIKNSWGTSLAPESTQGDALKGYYDLYIDTYLNARIPEKPEEGEEASSSTRQGLNKIILPPATYCFSPPEADPTDPVGDCNLCEIGDRKDPQTCPEVADLCAIDPYCCDTAYDTVCVNGYISENPEACPTE